MKTLHESYLLLPIILELIGIFDPYGDSHSSRVTGNAVLLAIEIGIAEDSDLWNQIYLGSLIHDVGKIGIPESVRRFSGRYTSSERAVMQLHAKIGYDFLSHVNGGISEIVRNIVRHHHEDWEGQGYPDGLKGTAIPLEARIVRICDTYDALRNDRGYRPGFTREKAEKIMIDEQIKQQWADGVLLRKFLEMKRDS